MARWFRGWRLVLVTVLVAAVGVVAGPIAWIAFSSAGHRHAVGEAPSAPVVIVFGAELAPGGRHPKSFLAGRLDIAAELVRTGKARAVLVSGDADGGSGNEVSVMTDYLVARGVPGNRIVTDPYGLDSYDTCARAAQVYGVRKALLVSQSFHLPRAVTLCRHHGVEAEGVAARCHPCRQVTLRKNKTREVAAAVKAALDTLRDRQPAVESPPDPAVTDALRR